MRSVTQTIHRNDTKRFWGKSFSVLKSSPTLRSSLRITARAVLSPCSSLYIWLRDRIPKTVTSFSLGSQVIGGEEFQKAFEVLERNGLLRHLRVTNKHDPIPLMPPMRWYKPVGMHLHLYHTTTRSQLGFDIHHASDDSLHRWTPGGQGWASSTRRLWLAYREANHNIDQLIEWHNIPAYLRRLERNKEALERLSLNECYRSKELTGSNFETLIRFY